MRNICPVPSLRSVQAANGQRFPVARPLSRRRQGRRLPLPCLSFPGLAAGVCSALRSRQAAVAATLLPQGGLLAPPDVVLTCRPHLLPRILPVSGRSALGSCHAPRGSHPATVAALKRNRVWRPRVCLRAGLIADSAYDKRGFLGRGGCWRGAASGAHETTHDGASLATSRLCRN